MTFRAWTKAALNFFTAPASPRPLGALRLGLSAVLILQAYLIAPEVLDFYGRSGVIQGPLNDYFVAGSIRGLPRIGWFSGFFRGVDDAVVVRAVFLVYLAALGYLLLGYYTRMATFVVWFAHSILLNTGYFFSYGAVRFAAIALFYLLWVPAGGAYSIDRLLGRVSGAPSSWARLGLRGLQIHLCIAYLATGIAKASGSQWWTGEAIWRAVMLPHFHQYDLSWLAFVPGLARLAGWTTLVAELGYGIFIWPKATRKIWVALMLSLHFGIALFLGLRTFSMVMMTLTFCAFGMSAEEAQGSRLVVLTPPVQAE